MKIEELLEYKIYTIDDDRARTSVKVIENPNKMQFKNLLYDGRSSQLATLAGRRDLVGVVRGLVVNDDIYIWIAYDATHSTVKQFLIRQGIEGEFILFIFEVVDDPNVDVKLWIYNNVNSAALAKQDKLNTHPAFKRMTRNMKIRKW